MTVAEAFQQIQELDHRRAVLRRYIMIKTVNRIMINDIKTSTPRDIISVVERATQISERQMRSKNRSSEIVRARSIAMYLMKQYQFLPLIQIGRQFDRDHATAHFAIKKVENEVFFYNTRGRDQMGYVAIIKACEKMIEL